MSLTPPIIEKKPRKKKPDGLTKVIRVELVGSDGDFAAEKKRLTAISVQMQQVTNDFTYHWLRLHQEAGNHLLIRDWMEKNRIRKAAQTAGETVEKCGKCPVVPYSREMSHRIYRLLNDDHSNLGTKPIGIIIKKMSEMMVSAPSSRSAYNRWFTILSGFGEFPQTRSPAPIPFYIGNSKIIAPQTVKEPWKLRVNVEKNGEGRLLRSMVFKMRTGGRKLTPIREALWKITSGEWIFSTSNLVFRHGVWYAHICYKIPWAEKPSTSTKTAFVSPGYHHPMLVRIDGRTRMNLLDSTTIAHTRRSLTRQRFGKSESYKYASSARKGHGRKQADGWRDKCSNEWRNTVKTTNDCWAATVIKRCLQRDVGHLVVFQPTDKWSKSRCLTNAGKLPGKTESTGWDWYRMQLALQQAGKVAGIKVTIRHGGEPRKKSGELQKKSRKKLRKKKPDNPST
jgi:hypothetical protein